MSTLPIEKSKVAVIGSGLGGLASAVQLAHAGCDVTVFEKNEQLGGRLGTLELEGFTWDTKPSGLTQPEILRQFWNGLDRKLEDYLTLIPLQIASRNFWADGTRIDDDKAFRQQSEVAQFLAYGKGAYEIAEPFISRRLDWWKHLPACIGSLQHLPKLIPGLTMHWATQKFFKDPHLVQMFDHFATHLGSSPFSTPAVMTCLPYLQAEHGSWHIQGGTHRIIEALLKVAGELGVELRTGCEITGVYDSSLAIAGKWTTFDAVICNQDVLMAYQSLLPRRRCGEFRNAYLDKFKTSLSSFILHLGVDQQYPQLAHHNVFFSEDHKQEFRKIITERALPEEPTIHLSVSSRTEPGLAPEGCDNWCLRVDTPPMRTSLQWGEIAQSFGDQIIQRLETRFGFKDLHSHIVARAHVSPADFRNRFLCFGGCLQGFASHNLRNTLIGPAMEPPGMTGFYFVGPSMRPGGGISQVLQNAKNATSRALHHLNSLSKQASA